MTAGSSNWFLGVPCRLPARHDIRVGAAGCSGRVPSGSSRRATRRKRRSRSGRGSLWQRCATETESVPDLARQGPPGVPSPASSADGARRPSASRGRVAAGLAPRRGGMMLLLGPGTGRSPCARRARAFSVRRHTGVMHSPQGKPGGMSVAVAFL